MDARPTWTPFALAKEKTVPSIDLNSDLGESFGRYTLGCDTEIIPLVSSCNIACGAHAGDPVVMRNTVALAAEAGIALGAHPGYPDLQGFGRRSMVLSPDETYACVLAQIGALSAFCTAKGVRLHHVKPHGQLYNTAAKDLETAQAIAEAVRDFDANLVLVGLAGSNLIEAGKTCGLATAQEFFLDRNYNDDGTLRSRTLPDAVIADEEFAIARAIETIKTGIVRSYDGVEIPVHPGTICVHGDTPQALAYIRRIREAFKQNGIEIAPVGK